MTVEELKLEAKKLGYNIIKKPESIKLLPCACNNKKPKPYYRHVIGKKNESGHFYWCQQCDMKSEIGKTHIEAKRKWNEAIERVSTNESVHNSLSDQ